MVTLGGLLLVLFIMNSITLLGVYNQRKQLHNELDQIKELYIKHRKRRYSR